MSEILSQDEVDSLLDGLDSGEIETESDAAKPEPVEGIAIEVPDPKKIKISGIDKQKVGQAAAEIRAFRPPEPYKGKGGRYAGEQVRRKAGKAAVGTGF